MEVFLLFSLSLLSPSLPLSLLSLSHTFPFSPFHPPRGVVPLRQFAFSPRKMWGLAMRAPSMVSSWSPNAAEGAREGDRLSFQAPCCLLSPLACFATDDFRFASLSNLGIAVSRRPPLLFSNPLTTPPVTCILILLITSN